MATIGKYWEYYPYYINGYNWEILGNIYPIFRQSHITVKARECMIASRYHQGTVCVSASACALCTFWKARWENDAPFIQIYNRLYLHDTIITIVVSQFTTFKLLKPWIPSNHWLDHKVSNQPCWIPSNHGSSFSTPAPLRVFCTRRSCRTYRHLQGGHRVFNGETHGFL